MKTDDNRCRECGTHLVGKNAIDVGYCLPCYNRMMCDDSEDDFNDEDEIEERRENERFERALNCTCGAWVISQDKTKVLHVADCICGAD